jgi:hypothetical protein
VASVVADVFHQRQCHDQQDTQDSQVIGLLFNRLAQYPTFE